MSSYPTSTATIISPNYTNNYTLHTFNTNGIITFPFDIIAPVLLVGAGGASGLGNNIITYNTIGGGGGSGQMIYGNVQFSKGTYSISVGTGISNADGNSSSLSGGTVNIVASGGKKGINATEYNNHGGGNGGNTTVSPYASGFIDTYVSSPQNVGGLSYRVTISLNNYVYRGGGGAGAGGNGVTYQNLTDILGGSGLVWPITGKMYANGGGAGNAFVYGNTSTNPGSGGGSAKLNIINTSVSGVNGIVVIAIPYEVLYATLPPILCYNGVSVLPPVTSMSSYYGNSDPDGWVICNGITRTVTDNRYQYILSFGIGSGTGNNYIPPIYQDSNNNGINWILKY